MKISVNQYAKALYASVEKKSAEDVDGAVVNFFKILQKNNQLKLVNKIIEKFSDIWNKENGIVEAEVISREKLSGELAVKINDFIKEKYSAKEVIIKNIVDEEIKGGVIIKVGDEVMDGSVSGQLSRLKECLSH